MRIFGGTKLYYVMFVGVASVIPATALAVPVVPNFTQGSMTSHTETTSKVTETINSIDYNTGWQYSVTGTNVNNGDASLNPSNVSNTVMINPLGGIEGQVSSTTSSANLGASNFKITDPKEAFQFTQTYSGPGMSNQTIIQRVTEVTSVTDTTSVFTQ
jgi:hypothetical protein